MAIKAKILGTTGDKDLFSENGGVVYENDYGIQYEFWQWGEDNDGEGRNQKAMLYRCNVEPDVFAHYDWAKVKRIASLLDMTEQDLRALGKDEDPMERVVAIDGIVAYHGAESLDEYPIEMIRKDLRKRYPGL